jgi:hypothetical protein
MLKQRSNGLVSFCLFGPDKDDIYNRGLLRNLEMYQEWKPDWKIRVYLGDTPSQNSDIHIQIEEYPNAEVILCQGETEDWKSTFWRFRALKDVGYDFYLFRDVDSRPILRERLAVEAWLKSDRKYHIMRDHPRHGATILAGMWGVKAPEANKVSRLFPNSLSGEKNYYMVEQEFLARTVWPRARMSVLQHVDCEWTFKTQSYPFPVKRSSEGFVGEGFLGNGQPRFPKHRFELKDKDVFIARGKSGGVEAVQG